MSAVSKEAEEWSSKSHSLSAWFELYDSMTVWWRCMSSLGHDCCQAKIIRSAKGLLEFWDNNHPNRLLLSNFIQFPSCDHRVSKIQHLKTTRCRFSTKLPGLYWHPSTVPIQLVPLFPCKPPRNSSFCCRNFLCWVRKAKVSRPKNDLANLVLGVKWVSSDISVI